MTSCVCGVVWVMWQTTCGVVIRSVINENGTGGSSPFWMSSPFQSIVVPSSRGGVPVFSRPRANPQRRRVCDKPSAGGSPAPRAGVFPLPNREEPAEKGPSGQANPAGRDPPPVAEEEPADPPGSIEQQIL